MDNIWKINLCCRFSFIWRHPSLWREPFIALRKKIQWSWQRIKRGYCDYDLYNLDSTLIQTIPDMLDSFISRTHGYPDNSRLQELGIVSMETWQNYVREMANKFREANADDENEFDYISQTEQWAKREIELAEEHQKRLEEALDMMKPVFFALWD